MKNEPNIQDSAGAAITAVARSRFRRFGYAKTSMQEIATECDMSVANLYRYYDGKLAIGAAVAAAEQSVRFADCDRAVAAARGDLTAKLTVFFHALIDSTLHQIKTAPLLFELGVTVAREQPEVRQRFLREVELRLAALLAAHGGDSLPVGGVAAASRLMLTASAPFVLPWMLRTQPFGNPRAQVEPLMTCLVSGFAKAALPVCQTAPA